MKNPTGALVIPEPPQHPPQHPTQHPPPLAGWHGQPPPAPAWFDAALAQAPERGALTVQGTPIEWLAWGRVGDPGLLLLHGNGAHADWYSFIAPLLLPGRRVVAMSFSGMGRSGWRTQYGVAQWADEALAVARATGLLAAAQPPVVAAHSFGGFVLANLAARHGAQLGRALVIDTPLRGPSAREQQRQRHRAESTRSGKVYGDPAQALARFRLLPPQACANPFIAHHIASHGLKAVAGPQGQPGWTWRFDPHLFRHFTFGRPWQDLAQPLCPLVLVRGGRSALVSASQLQLAQAQAGHDTLLAEIADADHHVMLDQPLALAELLCRWVPTV